MIPVFSAVFQASKCRAEAAARRHEADPGSHEQQFCGRSDIAERDRCALGVARRTRTQLRYTLQLNRCRRGDRRGADQGRGLSRLCIKGIGPDRMERADDVMPDSPAAGRPAQCGTMAASALCSYDPWYE